MTGLPCPGCGLTRAWVFAAHGRLGDALAANPFVLVTMPAAIALVAGGLRGAGTASPAAGPRSAARATATKVVVAAWLGFALVRVVAVPAATPRSSPAAATTSGELTERCDMPEPEITVCAGSRASSWNDEEPQPCGSTQLQGDTSMSETPQTPPPSEPPPPGSGGGAGSSASSYNADQMKAAVQEANPYDHAIVAMGILAFIFSLFSYYKYTASNESDLRLRERCRPGTASSAGSRHLWPWWHRSCSPPGRTARFGCRSRTASACSSPTWWRPSA